jgi:hypothetical protein
VIKLQFTRPAAVATAMIVGLSALAMAGAPASAAPRPASPAVAAFTPSPDAVPGIAPRGVADTSVYLDSKNQVINMVAVDADTPAGAAASAALLGCTPESGHDNPHRSGTGVAVSGHGWWKKGNCSNDRANVFNCLYEWYTDGTWRQKACSATKTLRPYTGSGDRTVARHDCNTTRMISWRNHVDVDVVGEIDSGEKPYRQANVACEVN